MKGTLFILPTVIAEETHREVIPASVVNAARDIHFYLCENIRTARRFVSSLKVHD
jgi:16S rRNA (cytidine1402-2'-O)-methyltransferase